MENTVSYLLANTYSSLTPFLKITAAVCNINGQEVPCPNFMNFLAPVMGFSFFVLLILMVIMIIANWKIYTKARQPGWASIIPIYNIIVLLQIIGRPIWWIILFFIPVVNIIMTIIISYELAKSFGKDIGFTAGLIVLPFIFYPILAFGQATYTPPQTNTASI